MSIESKHHHPGKPMTNLKGRTAQALQAISDRTGLDSDTLTDIAYKEAQTVNEVQAKKLLAPLLKAELSKIDQYNLGAAQ